MNEPIWCVVVTRISVKAQCALCSRKLRPSVKQNTVCAATTESRDIQVFVASAVVGVGVGMVGVARGACGSAN